jgi:hypothetical protein
VSKGNASVRQLRDLRGIGPAMIKDFEMLGIQTVAQDPCVLDTFRCAVAQAKDPLLPSEQTNWWYWSRIRKRD